MKLKKWLLALATFAVMAVLCAVCAGAETYGNFEYEVFDDGTVAITGYNGSAKKVDIPKKIDGKSVTVIHWWAFENCTSLESVTIPDSVTHINISAFEGCTSLAKVTIPDSVTSIGENAFNNTALLENQTTAEKYVGKWVVECDDDAKSITIKNGTKGIANNVFEECTSLTSVTIPNSVTSIGSYAFRGCTSLAKVTIPNSVKSIGSCAFSKCVSLTSIMIPDSVTNIDSGAFADNTKLKSITISKNLTEIQYSTFAGCSSLVSVTIPSKVKTIAREAFYYCESLKSVNIPDSVTSIGMFAFENCGALKAVTIPASVTNVGETAFGYDGGEKIDGFKITCYKGTAGEKYAKNCGFSYVLSTKPSGITGAKLGGRASNALRINWTKNTTADGYIVELYQNGKWSRVAKITKNSTTTYRASGLKASTVYKFRVKAYKMSGKTALYSAYSSTVTARTNPSAVKGVKIAGKATNALRVNWTKNTSAQGYIVEMYKGGKWVRVAKIANSNTTTYRKSGLAKNTTYKFRVKAYYMSGKTALYGGYGSVSGKTAAK